MWVSLNWIGRHVDLAGDGSLDLAELERRFILGVAEIEDTKHIADLPGVVVGHVLEVHEMEGSKVQRTLVDLGPLGHRTIVCGAPNITEGQLVCVATVGSVLPGDFAIGDRVVRGVESKGMICGLNELDLGPDNGGIFVIDPAVHPEATPGMALSDVVPIADTLFEIDNKSLTHRPDLWGHRGLAREVAALIGKPLNPMNLDVAFTDATPLTISVEDSDACPRYTAACMDGVTVRQSPLWMSVLLHRVGVRPISNVVDATNFVMLDLGNPLHAFDRRQISGDTITVRRAADGETFTTLDRQERKLVTTDLLIADADGGIALAGVMGGQDSEIRDDTTSIVLEAATFAPTVIRTTSSRLGLRSDSSARFEKSLDPHLPPVAAKAFIALLQSLDPNVRVTSALQDVCAPLPAPTVIDLRLSRVDGALGIALGDTTIIGYLERLDFGVSRPDGPGSDLLRVAVPTNRATKDITIEMDLVEEIGRSFGYDNIPPAGPRVQLMRPHHNNDRRFEAAVRTAMSFGAGFDEMLTYAFDFEPTLKRIGGLPEDPTTRVRVQNPISAERVALRRDLVPGLLGVLELNARRDSHVRIYEIGRVFFPHPEPGPGNLPTQPTHLAGLLAEKRETADAGLFFGLKSVLDSLGRSVERKALDVRAGGEARPWEHPTRRGLILLDGVEIGRIAEIHPTALKGIDATHQAVAFELNLDALRESEATPMKFQQLPKFPNVFRDFAVVVSESHSAGEVSDAIAGASPLVRQVDFQSVWRGAGVEDGQKCLAWSVTMRDDDATLSGDTVQSTVDAIWGALAAKVGGTLRA